MPEKKLSFKSIGWLSIINAAIAVVGILQTIVLARIFGASREVEVYFAATTFLMLLMKISSSGQMGDLFTPIFHDVQIAHGRKASHRAFSVMMNVMFCFSITVFLFAWFYAAEIAAYLVPGFSPEELQLCTKFFSITAPLVVVNVTSGMFNNFLRAEHYYGVNESLALVSKIINLGILIFLGWTWGIWALILGIWVGALIRLTGQLGYAWRNGFRHSLAFSTSEFHPREVLTKVPFSFCHIFSAQFLSFMVTAGLSFLPEGTFAVFTYASRLSEKFTGLVLQPIGVVFFNRVSQTIAEGAGHARDLARHALSLSVATAFLCVVPVICGGDYLLQGLWGSEKFSPPQIRETHLALSILVMLLIGKAQYLITRRTNLAMKVVASQFIASGLVQIVAGGCCRWIIPSFGLWGALGIQVGAVIVMAAVSLAVLRWKNEHLVSLVPFRKSCQWLLAGTGAVVSTMLLRSLFQVNFSNSRIDMAFAASGFGLFSLSLCFCFSWLIGITESREIFDKVRYRLARKPL